jgi:hypothetical protein
LRQRADELEFILARHGARLNRAVLDDPSRRLPTRAEIAPRGPLWDSLSPLASALAELERALAVEQKSRGEGDERHGAETAAADA